MISTCIIILKSSWNLEHYILIIDIFKVSFFVYRNTDTFLFNNSPFSSVKKVWFKYSVVTEGLVNTSLPSICQLTWYVMFTSGWMLKLHLKYNSSLLLLPRNFSRISYWTKGFSFSAVLRYEINLKHWILKGRFEIIFNVR